MGVNSAATALAALSGLIYALITGFMPLHLLDHRSAMLVDSGLRLQALHTMAALASLSVTSWGGVRARFAPPWFLAGIVLYTGSHFWVAAEAPRQLLLLARAGSMCFAIGWLILILAGIDLAMRRGASTTSV